MNPIQITSQSPVFKEAPDVLRDIKTLCRIANLNDSIWEDERREYLQELRQTWSKSKETLATGSLEKTKEYLSDRLQRLDLRDLYGCKIEEVQTAQKLEHLIQKFNVDVNSGLSNPLKKSTRGNKEQTFLVSFPLQKKRGILQTQSYVMKWTQWNELSCTRIYQVFSRFLLQQGNSSSFLVPNVCGFNLEANIHETGAASRISMETQIQVELNKTLNQIAKIGAPKHPLPDKLVMLCERINGENLFDFAISKYAHLEPSQKVKLFTQLGRIALLDLIIGNLDRIVQINFSTKEDSYTLLDCEANFGNIMVEWTIDSGVEPAVFAIDNGIENVLVEDPARIAKYQGFLDALLSDPEMEAKLVENMLASFQHAIATQADDLSVQNAKMLRGRLQEFSRDIETFGKKCFAEGLQEMEFLCTKLSFRCGMAQKEPVGENIFPPLIQKC